MNNAILKFRRYEDASLGWTAPCLLSHYWHEMIAESATMIANKLPRFTNHFKCHFSVQNRLFCAKIPYFCG